MKANAFANMMKDLLENNPAEAIAELEKFTTEQLRTLWKVPGIEKPLLEAMCKSTTLTENWNRMLDEDYQAMTAEERERLDAIAQRLHKKFTAPA